MFGKITGLGSFIPEKVLENADLEQMTDTDSQWIISRTGIERRHVMASETVSQMAARAASQAVSDAGIDPADIDLIIVSSTSADVILPNVACYVQAQLGAGRAMGIDMNAACTGFIAAYNTAQAYIHAGIYRTVLVVAAEGLSRIVDWTDRSTCILFGDGAGAVLLQADEAAVFDTVMHADGRGGTALVMDSIFKERPRLFDEEKTADDASTYVSMDGQAVYRFAVRCVPDVIRELMERINMQPEDIKAFLLHQANSRILRCVAKRLGLPEDRFPMNIADYGNTSSASIPILLHEMVRTGKIRRGDQLIMSGFGGGLTWAATWLIF